MINTYKINKIYRSDKNKDGTPVIHYFTKKPGFKVALGIDGIDGWFTTIVRDQNAREYKLQEGSEVKLILSERNGFKNFKLPSDIELLTERVEALEKIVSPNVYEQLRQRENTPDYTETNDVPF